MLPATEVEFVQDGEELRLIRSRPSKSAAISRGETIVRRLEGSATSDYSTDEIMRMTRGDD